MGKENQLQETSCVELSASDGVAFIEQTTPLTRLHYFDGKFLRADALALEQDYHRERTRLANLAGGWGAVHGLNIALSGNRLQVGSGLAVTPAGNFVLAASDFSAAIADLIAVANPTPKAGNSGFDDCLQPPGNKVTEGSGLNLYEISVGPVAGLCGQESVFGKLCESACASSSQHPYWREGVVLRLRPLSIALPASTAVKFTSKHLINRVASGYFAAEPWLTPAALSAAGLSSDLWCRPTGLYERDEVVIGLLIRDAGKNRIDAWSGRRERMDTQARGYWQGRMAMRPWNVFVAQILQFQCELASVFDNSGGVLEIADDCDELRELLDRTRRELEVLQSRYAESTEKILLRMGERTTKKDVRTVSAQIKGSYAEILDLSNLISQADLAGGALPAQRMLINAGFAELPPAGYLPVVPGKRPPEEQLPRMFGEGVRLNYHAVRRDEIAHLVEEAQHLDRISLTQGLDDADRVEDVEIFVPDGDVVGVTDTVPGEWWQVDMDRDAIGAFELVLESDKDQTAEEVTKAVAKTLHENAVMNLIRANSSSEKQEMITDAPHAAEAGEARSDDLVADTAENAQEIITMVSNTLRRMRFSGLARTEGREDGSYGFTLAARLDSDIGDSEIEKLIKANSSSKESETLAHRVSSLARSAFYLSGDIDTDPLKLPLNATTNFKGELALGRSLRQINGTLTVLFDRPLSGGRTERVVEFTLTQIDSTRNVSEGKSHTIRARISLRRDGRADDGAFVVDDAAHDAGTSPIFFHWQSAPRKARMSILDDDTAKVLTLDIMHESSGRSNNRETAVRETLTITAAPRRELVAMHGLDAIPDIDSAIGAAAMNALVAISEGADDPAFFARARRRLFPTLDSPPTESVRAALDWVMFRRARTQLCCPQLPTVPVKPVVEAFQAWHLIVSNREELKVLQNALDRNLSEELARFKFARVGVLRFRNESTVAEETETQIEAMWRDASPAPEVVLGRYWEQAPTTGQGWQNRFRLTTMLEQISEITAPPPVGSGAIAGLTGVSPPLSDSGTDGGFLVVTLAGESATRNALIIYSPWDDFHHVDEGSPRADIGFVNDVPQDGALAEFITKLATDNPVAGISIAATQSAPDTGANARMREIVKSLEEAGRPAPPEEARFSENLSERDRERLSSIDIEANDYDDIIFLESNSR